MTTEGGTAEQRRLAEARDKNVPWRKWGPYLSERQWGTVREDYSDNGDAWNYFSHDQARSRAYHWGEDGLAGFCDDKQRLCFALLLLVPEHPLCLTVDEDDRSPTVHDNNPVGGRFDHAAQRSRTGVQDAESGLPLLQRASRPTRLVVPDPQVCHRSMAPSQGPSPHEAGCRMVGATPEIMPAPYLKVVLPDYPGHGSVCPCASLVLGLLPSERFLKAPNQRITLGR